MNGDVYSSSMDFRLSDQQVAFQRHCHAFARDVMRPAAARYDREQTVPYDVIREARARGLHGLEYLTRAGADETGLTNAIYAEELHWGCAGIALAISARRWPQPASRRPARRSRSGAGCPHASARATRSASAPTR